MGKIFNWNSDEVEIIKNNYVKYGSEYVRILLYKHNASKNFYPDRTNIAIRAKAHGLGLNRANIAKKEAKITVNKNMEKFNNIYNYRKKVNDEEYLVLPQFAIDSTRRKSN